MVVKDVDQPLVVAFSQTLVNFPQQAVDPCPSLLERSGESGESSDLKLLRIREIFFLSH
jgi:hypothetical protein